MRVGWGGLRFVLVRFQHGPTSFEVSRARSLPLRSTTPPLVALHQAHNASSPEVREGFLRIARDEARHALLSLELDDWMRTRVSANQVRQRDETRALAMLEVAENVGREDVATRTVLGLPDEERGRDLVRFVA